MTPDLESIWKVLRGEYGELIEPFDSWRNADAHRMFWRPDEVKVVLLAESHVFTGENELDRTVDFAPFISEEIPTGFVRLVYCLGYGENELLNSVVDRNGGTPQFWKLFYACLHRISNNNEFAPILVGGTPSIAERVQNKLELLRSLKRNGIWLLDASLASLYPRPDKAGMYENCIEKSWSYINRLISEACPEQIVVIGAGVRDQLLAKVDALDISWNWIYQPQAHLGAEGHLANYQNLYDFVHGIENTENQCASELSVLSVKSKPEPIVGTGRNWTFNEQTGFYSQRVALSCTPLILTLWSRMSSGESRSDEPVVESCLLDLHELLAGGHIRYDSSIAGETNVRVVIFHDNDGCYYIRTKRGNSGYLLS